MALRRAAQRIRCNVRRSDLVLLLDTSCAIVLPATPLIGAQAVAKRIYTLLADIEYELQILSGSAAWTLLQHWQTEQALIVVNKAVEVEAVSTLQSMAQLSQDLDTLPYLAFLANYPSHRLLNLFPYDLALRYRCVPVGADRGVLTLATCQRLNQEVVLHFQEVTQRDIFQVRCEAGIIEDVLCYWQNATVL
ncbi:MAG: hypothetical protein JOZ18_05405 [Chloroflexi bacterium]|nr:hypothetical protein [Chloroflexota bacterium]